jgi:hypothetical protein
MTRLTLSLVLVGMIIMSLTGIPRADAADPCNQWDVTGTWSTQQGNGYAVTFNFSQSGQNLGGSAGYGSVSGGLSGTIQGNQLNVVVGWSNGSRGRYVATVSQGSLTGTTSNVATGASTSWTGSGPTRCASAPPPPPPAPTTVLVTPKVSCSGSGDLRVSGQEMDDIAKFRSRPGISQGDAEDAAVQDIAALARSRGGSGSVKCGGRSMPVEPPAPPVPTQDSPPVPAQDSCDVAIGRLQSAQREISDQIKVLAVAYGVDLGTDSSQRRAIIEGMLDPISNFGVMAQLKELSDGLDAIEAALAQFQAAKEAGESCPALP